jgi:hypothetical protein
MSMHSIPKLKYYESYKYTAKLLKSNKQTIKNNTSRNYYSFDTNKGNYLVNNNKGLLYSPIYKQSKEFLRGKFLPGINFSLYYICNNPRFTFLYNKFTTLFNKFRKNSSLMFDLAYLVLCIQYFVLTIILLICVIKLAFAYKNTYILIFSPWVMDIYCLLFITLLGNLYNFYYRGELLKHRNAIYLAPVADYGMWLISTDPYRELNNNRVRLLNIEHVSYDFYHNILPWAKLRGSKTVIGVCIDFL